MGFGLKKIHKNADINRREIHNLLMRISKLFATFSMFFSSALQAAGPTVYVVKNGETLSTIAQSQVGSPVFKKAGSLFKLLKWNPNITDANLIFVGQSLSIGPSHSQRISKAEKTLTPAEPPRTLASDENSELPQHSSPQLFVQDPVQKIISTENEIPHHVELLAAVGMTTVSGIDNLTSTNAVLFSNQDIAVGARWKQHWTNSFFTSFGVALRSIDFQPPTSSSKSISESKKLNSSLSLSAGNKLTQKLALNYGLSYGNELFLRGLSSTTVTVDALPIAKLNLGATIQLYESGLTSFGINANLDSLMGASTEGYTVSSGAAYQGGIYLKRRYGTDSDVELNVGYKDRAQNTSLVNFNEKTFFGSLVFSLRLFEKSEVK